MGFFPREFMLRKVRHHNFYELADKLESVSLLALFGGRRKEGKLSLDTLEDVFICPLKTETVSYTHLTLPTNSRV
mgnify:CR=1 FL=1